MARTPTGDSKRPARRAAPGGGKAPKSPAGAPARGRTATKPPAGKARAAAAPAKGGKSAGVAPKRRGAAAKAATGTRGQGTTGRGRAGAPKAAAKPAAPRARTAGAAGKAASSTAAGIVTLMRCGARFTARQHNTGVHAAIWTHVSCRQTWKVLARTRRY